MYNEKSFENYIFWTKVRRIFLILLFSIIGCLLGIFISDIIQTITINDSYRIIIIFISTLSFFALSLLLTIGTAREVQDGYWKMAVLRKLTVMSKKLDNIENLRNFKEELNNLESIENNINEIEETESNETEIEIQVQEKNAIPQEIKTETIPESPIVSEKNKKSKRTISKSKTI